MKISELQGAALDWAVAKAKGYAEFVLDPKRFMDMHETGHYNYSTDWAQGGPIIEREMIELSIDGDWKSRIYDESGDFVSGRGQTPLIAAMRCYVASKLGEEVEVPGELMGAA